MKKAVFVSCFDWYEIRLKPICELLQKEYEVTVLLSDFDHVTKETCKNRNPECEYIQVIPYKKNLSIQRLRSHFVFSKSVYARLNRIKPDFIYALVPPNSVARYCVKYKSEHDSVKLIFDIIDLWPESMPLGPLNKTPPCMIWRNLRNSNLKYADYVFTECELYQSYLKKYLPGKYSALYLFKKTKLDHQKLVLERIEQRRSKKNNDMITLGYLGSINHIIAIDQIKTIVSVLRKKYHVSVKVIGDGENRELFLETLKNAGAKVTFYGTVFDEKKKTELLADCDYGLNMMVDTVKVGLTMKSIDYFSYGIPLINNIKGDTWNFIDVFGAGINFEGDCEALLHKVCDADEEIYWKVYELFQDKFTIEAFQRNVRKGIGITGI